MSNDPATPRQDALQEPITAQQLETILDRLMQVVDANLASLKKDEPIDLTGLDERIAEICAAAEMLPKDQGSALAPRFATLLDRFDQLAAEMTPRSPDQDR